MRQYVCAWVTVMVRLRVLDQLRNMVSFKRFLGPHFVRRETSTPNH